MKKKMEKMSEKKNNPAPATVARALVLSFSPFHTCADLT
jgi:hypothetical protein